MKRISINRINYEVGSYIGACIFLCESEMVGDNWRRYGTFRCGCGNEFVSAISKVKSGHTKSCGCTSTRKIIEFNTKHSMTKSPEFKAYIGAKQRCYNPNNKRYYMWGGRGIRVCDRWLEGFVNFFEDMGSRPSAQHSLDRINVDGDYCKENCRWATSAEQSMNRRSNRLVTYKGDTKPLKMWTDELGLNYYLVSQRIRKLKWTTEKAFEYKK